MTPSEARAHAKRLFAQLSRLSPHTTPSSSRTGIRKAESPFGTQPNNFREKAAVLADVLSYASYEREAEDLALAVAGRYPADQAVWFVRGSPVRQAAQPSVLAIEVESARDHIFGPRKRRCDLSLRDVNEWLLTFDEAQPRDRSLYPIYIESIANLATEACRDKRPDAEWRTLIRMESVLYNNLRIHVMARRDAGFDYLDRGRVLGRTPASGGGILRSDELTLAFVGDKFVIAPLSELPDLVALQRGPRR